MAQHADFQHAQRAHEQSREHVRHDLHHTSLSRSHSEWGQDKTLHLAVAWSNPCRWKTRLRLFNNFRRHIEGLPNIVLHVGELAYGDRPFEVTNASCPTDYQWRTRETLWLKENVLNRVIAQFPANWEYGGYVDADFNFTRYDIGLETIHQLQQYAWVQMYSHYTDLTYDHRPMRVLRSVMHRFLTGDLPGPRLAAAAAYGYDGKPGRGVGTTGGAWAFRRADFDACGGLLDTCILGSADYHMAFGLMGEPDQHPNVAELSRCGQAYADSIKIWQNRAAQAVRKNVGFVNCYAVHHWHGSKQLRGYGERWKILRDHDYDPRRDVFPDHQGIYQLTPNKPALRDAIRAYFSSRSEDSIDMLAGDRLIGD